MNKKYYFMGGLPRSGSTLLSSILNQNPRFYSGPSSPVLGAMVSTHDNFLQNELYHGYPKPYQVNEIVGSIIGHWYSDVDKPVIIDKNRAWTSNVSFIEGYLNIEPKIILPVRRVDEILTSILKMIHRNPFKEGQSRINFVDEFLVKNNTPINDEERCNHLLNPSGIVYESLNAIMDGFKDQKRDKFHFIDYNDLVNDPQKEMDSIYDFLGEESFEHSFDDLSNQYREDDLNTYGLTDMHEVRSDISKTSDHPSNVLPSSIIDLYNRNRQNLEFWTEPEVVKINPPKVPTSYNIFS